MHFELRHRVLRFYLARLLHFAVRRNVMHVGKLVNIFVVLVFEQRALMVKVLEQLHSNAFVKLMHEARCQHSFASAVTQIHKSAS